MAVEHSGRLELTWTNKHLRLLSDHEGGYTWVPPADYRVAEVRLLHDLEEVGETRTERSRAKDNLLIAGDALNALTSLCELPELAREYVGKVKLAYLDPPFNTQQAFEHYDDALSANIDGATSSTRNPPPPSQPTSSKMDKELESFDVKGKETAALRWANHVSAKTGVAWRYLLVGETDIATARGSWSALRGA